MTAWRKKVRFSPFIEYICGPDLEKKFDNEASMDFENIGNANLSSLLGGSFNNDRGEEDFFGSKSMDDELGWLGCESVELLEEFDSGGEDDADDFTFPSNNWRDDLQRKDETNSKSKFQQETNHSLLEFRSMTFRSTSGFKNLGSLDLDEPFENPLRSNSNSEKQLQEKNALLH